MFQERNMYTVLFVFLLMNGVNASCDNKSDSWLTWTNAATAALTVVGGATAIVAAPLVVSAVGFGSAGVVAGSLAASLQGPAVAAGSWFAIGQSVGAAGFGIAGNAVLLGTGSATGYVTSKVASNILGE
ncbi:interferon alpha-inducible protein 27-like protein 2B [Dreissena polymorpha]|nr:interferon alpha-inducible protein 27-like protein 2B [Dreissena polymorpha]